jgi:hypothetical protein
LGWRLVRGSEPPREIGFQLCPDCSPGTASCFPIESEVFEALAISLKRGGILDHEVAEPQVSYPPNLAGVAEVRDAPAIFGGFCA